MAALGELFELVHGLASGTYPAFVTRRDLRGEVPVFLYHKVDPERMDLDFAHLRRNDYSTLHAAAHLAALSEPKQRPERSAVITYDDGLQDLYTHAFPLLVKHRLKAVAFIIPSRVGGPGMVTWDQVREMHESGLVDIQSHSLHHAAIPTSPVVDDFFHPGYRFYWPWDIPVDVSWTRGVPAFPPPLGYPIWVHGSRLDDAPRFVPDPGFEGCFAQHVESSGGRRFFETRGWRGTLEGLARRYAANGSGVPGRYESPEEQRAAVRVELVESRERIETELVGARVRHLAYPWNLVGRITLAQMEECGYDSAYGGLTPFKGGPGSAVGEARFQLARISGDFIPCLPGKGRRSLLSTLGFKVLRRVTVGQPY